MQETPINPYEFLGLSFNASVSDVRKAYYQLARICHPDKGGRAEDMRVLQSAYEWIMLQLGVVICKGDETYEEKEKQFEAFLKSQCTENVMSWSQIEQEACAFDKEAFNKAYDSIKHSDDDFTRRAIEQLVISTLHNETHVHANQNRMEELVSDFVSRFNLETADIYHASVPSGYGDYMEVTTSPRSFGKAELIVYEEPEAALTKQNPTGAYVLLPKSLDNYTDGIMTDYRVAFQELDISLTTEETCVRNK